MLRRRGEGKERKYRKREKLWKEMISKMVGMMMMRAKEVALTLQPRIRELMKGRRIK